jgi:competence ComEA-like helix-hairpin-helix protein
MSNPLILYSKVKSVVLPYPFRSALTPSLGLLTLSLVACQTEVPQVTRPTPLPQDDQIQVYMNHEPAASYTEPYRQITRNGDNLEQVIIDTIAAARSTVDVAVQEFRLPGIAQALVERQKAGVRVRVILENTYSRPFSQFTAAEVARLPERDRDRYNEARRLMDLNNDGQLSQNEIDQRDGLVILDKARIPRIDDTADGSAGSNLMHHKFVVVDNRTIIVTSANFTTSDIHGDFKFPLSRGNANNLLKINSPELAATFTEEFNIMWGDRASGQSGRLFGVKKPFRPSRQFTIGASRVEVQFSPASRSTPWEDSSNGLIGRTLSSANQTIAMALFVFSDQTLVNRLEPLHRKGVNFKTLIDAGFAYRSYSEGLDMMGVALAENCQFEPDNRPWQPAIATVGVPRMPPGDLLHHKFGLVDGHTVITGSHNWTDAANRGNDETVIVIRNPIVAAHYQREFERLYTNAILGVPPAIQKKVAQNQQCPPSVVAHRNPARSGDAATPPQSSDREPNHKQSTRLAKQSPTKPLSPTKQTTHRINLNTATQAELESLPGVGPSLAKRIIAARQQKRFTSLADFDQLSGVGPKLLEKLKDRVTW